MEKLKLTFEARVLDESKTFVVEVPYEGGLVATSEYCPTELLSGPVELMAAIRGETLDRFMADCRLQLLAMEKIGATPTELDRHIGALMAVIMNHLGSNSTISFSELLTHIDCFSLLLKAAGFADDEIRNIYPRVTQTILDLYPDYITGKPQSPGVERSEKCVAADNPS